MPIYEYYCDGCGTDFEMLVWKSDEKKTQKCPKCGSEKTQRRFSTFASPNTSSSTSCSSPASTKFR